MFRKKRRHQPRPLDARLPPPRGSGAAGLRASRSNMAPPPDRRRRAFFCTESDASAYPPRNHERVRGGEDPIAGRSAMVLTPRRVDAFVPGYSTPVWRLALGARRLRSLTLISERPQQPSEPFLPAAIRRLPRDVPAIATHPNSVRSICRNSSTVLILSRFSACRPLRIQVEYLRHRTAE